MRQEDKEVDGPELEHAEERKRENELIREKDDELYDLDGKPETWVQEGNSTTVVAAMRTILAGEIIVLDELDLSKRHLTALEAFKTAVEGRDQKLHRFVYAEDRSTLLEQSLGVLQPELVTLQGTGAFTELIDEIGELRGELRKLDAAERSGGKVRSAPSVDATDRDDDPEDAERDDATARRSSLTGPERKLPPKPPSSLTGPERKPTPKPQSSLTGPERAPEPRPVTTLGDPKEIARAARRNSDG